ncbi:MAG TPA: 16S rRNA (guanine(966)-N(2))-methyltransferase RsmD [Acholeplasma sp.]|nr:16S rRNA (guanine(966)-N(2))-methyltransferase RsmD [Acholeplasma sp.]
MLKIHSGIYKGQTIKRVHVNTTKETASMVREAVFNSLFKIEGNVLDLFAGSGSYGITALSLGAHESFFVDNNIKAYKTIKDNLSKLKINAKVYNKDYQDFLKSNKIKFDYIFLDPPYSFNQYEELLTILLEHLNINGKVILEVDKKTSVAENEKYIILKEKNYGSKKVIIYSC